MHNVLRAPRVYLVVNGYPDAYRPDRGKYNERAARDLARLVDLTVILPRAVKPGRALTAHHLRAGVRTVEVSGPVVPGCPRLTVRLFRAFRGRWFRRQFKDADVVHSVGLERNGILCAQWASGLRCRHVTQLINNLGCMSRPRFEQYPYLRQLRQGVHGVICNSRYLEAAARHYLPETRHVRTLYRGVDLEEFTPEGPGLGPQAVLQGLRLLYLGGLPAYPDRQFGRNTKGGLTLMAAWREAESALSAASATLVFGGPDSAGRGALEWRASLREPGAVHMVGMVRPEQVASYLRASDAAIIPSLEEGFPNLAFEAAGCGRAVLGSDIEPLAEALTDGANGLLARAGDVSAWAALLRRVARPVERAHLAAMGRAAREQAVRYYDRHHYAGELVKFYRLVLGTEASPDD